MSEELPPEVPIDEDGYPDVEDVPLAPDGMPEGKVVMKPFKIRGFTTIEGKEDIVEELKQYYLGERKGGRTDVMQIFRDFKRHCQYDRKMWWNPYPTQIKSWIRNWEKSLPYTVRKVPIQGRDTVKKNLITEDQVIKEIAYHDLEDGAKNLQQILIDDANQLMKESNHSFEVIDEHGGIWDKGEYEKIRLKKKELALGIAKEVLAGVHKHELVAIKKNKEGRETAGFLMDLMKSATSGELSDEDLNLLEQGVGLDA